ncbi:response regulator transcription factor [Streptomyces inhibens]|uniref:response regulator transcription factor n=1 Tax=Streptomyces inhibens TaxID=2293571 RepID=UPI001EE7486D|nr:response regulator transcription factor [Streptomyces inhibens]UKY51766.1 response regulator transcription factor [Streptomyces inhibens]
MAMAVLTAMVVAPNEVFAQGLGTMLRALPMLAEVALCVGSAAAGRLIESRAISVLVCHTGAEPDPALAQLFARASALGVRTLAVLPDTDPEQAVTTAVELEADGYLLECDLTSAALDDTVRRLVRGEASLPPSLMHRMIARARTGKHAAELRPSLTPRERETLALLAEGLTNKQIARRLAITQHGVKRHVANVLAKLNCPNRTLAVAHALRDGLLDRRPPDDDQELRA